jgi:ATP-dependent DNA helicase RecG
MLIDNLEVPLEDFKNLNKKVIFKFKKYKILTIKDLLYFLPYKYLDLRKPIKIKEAKINDNVVIIAKIKDVKLIKTPKKKMFIVIAYLEDDTGLLKSIWYNQPYLLKVFKKGTQILSYGKLIKNTYGLHLANPDFHILKDQKNFKLEIIPVYYEISGLSTNLIRKIINNIIETFNIKNLQDPLPEIVRHQAQIISLGEALIKIHSPSSLTDIEEAKKRLIFEEIFYLQAKIIQEKLLLSQERGPIINYDENLVNEFLERINIVLSNNQKQVIEEIVKDLQSIYPMNRLLQGETGSGKTLIAEIISLLTAQAGYKVLLMAPTEVLATQHFYRFLKDFSSYDLGLGLMIKKEGYYGLRGFKTRKNKDEIFRLVAQEKIKILIGTHSLLEINHQYQNIGLIIVDEQQRFGIEQRKKLLDKTQQNYLPHFLSMTATPIPRSLYLAFYGDLSLSILREKPVGRKEIITKIINPKEISNLWLFVKDQLVKNHQIFIICPRVEINDNSDIKSVKEVYEKVKKIFPETEVAMLHGKMKSYEKEKILKSLQNNEIKILVASSVVEVGIDLPLLTTIIILGAERFGLSQLHQLRGRVGRSLHQGYCFLVPEKYNKLSYLRLKILEESQDAFYIAEKDLEIRGPGELIGNKQSGFPDLAMKALENIELVNLAKNIAENLLTTNPFLKNYPLLRNEIKKRSQFFLN